mmetsp:Transcript_26055/g.38557  ORF Transcript_26055/g.38557 Transcript_26055/m.38557 type:complete len:147 (-) Transcript_26055:361-801(-)|eukprot:CAMPEP_0195522814 /NCGR_PEP_ID=MMETSP0794_2-20130614/21355_1 /TAXON_ID=515487 /ORGANISM="Stephanopyxis turris, Strain CCMP 815" /LENGTH=146 /DNA_ID=CAMNT_0040652659 /DNA_START=224 /DNA_END=664 /DNA_ORIENTATION=+
MVFYECLFTAKNTASFHQLTNLMKNVALQVVENGGIVRGVQNHGIRQLPHRFKAKYPTLDGTRYYDKGRFVSVYYDSSPSVMRQVEKTLTSHEEVLRNTHLKVRNKLWYVNIDREEKNPYIQMVIAQEKQEEEEAKKKMEEAASQM